MFKLMIMASIGAITIAGSAAAWDREVYRNPLDGDSVVSAVYSDGAMAVFKKWRYPNDIMFAIISSDEYICSDTNSAVKVHLRFDGFPEKFVYAEVFNSNMLRFDNSKQLLAEANRSSILAVRTYDECGTETLMVFDTPGRPNLSFD